MKLKTAYILFALISISATSCRENDETMTSLEIIDINNQNTIKKINDSIIVSNMENSAGDPPPKKGVNWKH